MEQLEKFQIIKTITLFIIPYILLYSLYIQLNGEDSPGGGFQAGVIFASCLIGFEVIFGKNIFQEYISFDMLSIIAIIGVMIYSVTGFIAFIFSGNYLNYNSLAKNSHLGQELGIFAVELGVGFTVSSVMCLIYLLFQMLNEKPKANSKE